MENVGEATDLSWASDVIISDIRGSGCGNNADPNDEAIDIGSSQNIMVSNCVF